MVKKSPNGCDTDRQGFHDDFIVIIITRLGRDKTSNTIKIIKIQLLTTNLNMCKYVRVHVSTFHAC